MFDWLKGSKAYLVAAGIGLATVANNLGWIDTSIYQMVLGLLGAGGVAALRAGIKNK